MSEALLNEIDSLKRELAAEKEKVAMLQRQLVMGLDAAQESGAHISMHFEKWQIQCKTIQKRFSLARLQAYYPNSASDELSREADAMRRELCNSLADQVKVYPTQDSDFTTNPLDRWVTLSASIQYLDCPKEVAPGAHPIPYPGPNPIRW